MNLDINTPRGRGYHQDQLEAIKIVFRNDKQRTFIHTAGDAAAKVDGFILKDGVVTVAVEVKSREMSHKQLMGEFQGEWLLTYAKIEDIAKVSNLLCIPSYGFLYLKQDKIVAAVKLCDMRGNITCKHRTLVTRTQQTCNGGSIERLNAYVDMHNAKLYLSS